jgi:hypothetical protein
VLRNCEVRDIAILISDGPDGRLNVTHQRLHMTWRVCDALDSFHAARAESVGKQS